MSIRGGGRHRLEFVAVGHVCIDHVAGQRRLGGAAAYASLTAARLGLQAGCVSSAGRDFPFFGDLDEIELHFLEAVRSTEFENEYRGVERRQRLLARAAPIAESDLATIRPRLEETACVLYCPLADELQLPLLPLVPRGLCGVAPQGFFRTWNSRGLVVPREWSDAEAALSRADFVSVSERDGIAPEELAEGFEGIALAITRGARGSRVHAGADVYDLPAFPAAEVDPTGAGDVFAAAFLVALREELPVARAARFASAAAACSIEGPGVAAIPARAQVERRLLSALP